MREHAYSGYKILSKIPFLAEAAEIVYAHQECYDGTGYPRQLKGDQIPLGARIFSIADTLDAMTSDPCTGPRKPMRLRRRKSALLRDAVRPRGGRSVSRDPANFWMDCAEA